MLRSFLYWLAYRIGLNPRGIFTYYDGHAVRYGDPLAMARALWSIAGFDAADVRASIVAGDGMSVANAYGTIGTHVRAAWSIPELEDGGLTDFECETLLLRFEAYLGDLKKNGNRTQIGPAHTPDVVLPDISGFNLTKPTSATG